MSYEIPSTGSLSKPSLPALSEVALSAILSQLKRTQSVRVIRISGAHYVGAFIRVKDNKLQLYDVTVLNSNGGQMGAKNKGKRQFNLNTVASIELLPELTY